MKIETGSDIILRLFIEQKNVPEILRVIRAETRLYKDDIKEVAEPGICSVLFLV